MPVDGEYTSGANGAGRSGARPTYGKKYKPPGARSLTIRQFGGMEPGALAGVLSASQRGDLEQLADLFTYMLSTDAHVRSVVSTRINAVAAAPIDVLPGAGDEVLAELSAEFVRGELERIEEWEDRYSDLLYGSMLGAATVENRWRPEVDCVHGDLAFVLPRDQRFNDDWSIELRTYESGKQDWIKTRDFPGKFTVNLPHNFAERPTLTGEMRAIAWPWLFKRIVEKIGLEGFGRMATGLLYSIVSSQADENVIEQRLEDLEALATDGKAAIKASQEVDDPIRLLEAARDPGQTSKTLLDYYNGEISKGILGSGLNVEVQSTGGNRALGESQFDTTILPRLQADAKRALGALRRDFIKPLLAYNVHKFGGVMPPVPYLQARLVEDTLAVDQLTVDSGAATVDELRRSKRLPEWGPEKGGDRVLQPIAKSPFPGFSLVPDASGGTPTERPLRRRPLEKPVQLTLPGTGSSQTRSAFATTPLAIALSRKSAVRVR